MIKKLLIIVPVILALTVVSLFMPARHVTIESIGTLSFETAVTLTVGQQEAYASPDIAVDGTPSTGTGTGSSITVSHTTGSGENRLMLVGISGYRSGEDPTISSVTYGGVGLTLVGTRATPYTGERMWLYRLVAPVSGTANVVVTFDATMDRGAGVGVITFTGVDQSTPLGTFVSASGDSTTASVNVSSASDELVLDTLHSGGETTPTVGEGQTERWNLNPGTWVKTCGSTEPGAATVTMSWTFPENSWAIGAVPIKPPAPWLNCWAKRVKLTIDSGDIDAALSNFPILLYISESSGHNGVDISCVFDELQSDANRKKIAVTQSDGTTECYVEIEKWDDASEKAWLWVKVPSISNSAPTDLYLYYDSTHAENTTNVGDTNSNVWDSNYVAVWHLREDYALDFDGDDDYVNCGSDESLEMVDNLTVSLWFKTSATVTNQGLISKMDSNHIKGWLIYFEDYAKPGIFIGDGTGFEVIYCDSADTNDGNWHHIVYKYDGTAYMWFDGVEQEDSDTVTMVGDTNVNVEIGRKYSGTTAWEFDGIIDEVRIWNRALSDAEVLGLYQGKPVSRTGLVGEWLMSEGTGNAVADSSGEGNDGDMTDHAAAWRVIAKDSTSNANHGISEGDMTPEDFVTGDMGPALDFDGEDDVIDLPAIVVGNKATLAAWVNSDTATGGYVGGHWCPIGRYWTRHSLYIGDGRYSGRWNEVTAYDTDVYIEANWHFMVVTYDSSLGSENIKLYVDGEVIATANETGDTTQEDKIWQIGAHGNDSYYWDGKLDEVRISAIDRSAAWVLASFETGRDHLLDWGSEETLTSNLPTEKDFGVVVASSTPNTGNAYFTITNCSTVTIDINIKCNAWSPTTGTGIWVYGSPVGADKGFLKASSANGGTGGSQGAGLYDIEILNGTDSLLCDDVAVGTNPTWELQLNAPSSFTHGDEQQTTITLTVTCAP